MARFTVLSPFDSPVWQSSPDRWKIEIMGNDNSSRRELEQRAWEEHNLSQLRYLRSLSLREKMEAVEGMADVLRRFEEMRARGEFTSASGGCPAASHTECP
jgi:hypothetical protein